MEQTTPKDIPKDKPIVIVRQSQKSTDINHIIDTVFNDQINASFIPFEIQSKNFTRQTNGTENMDLNTWRQTRAVIVVCSCIFYIGFYRVIIASITNSQTSKQFQKLFNYTGNIVTTNVILVTVSPLGSLCGTLFCSYLIKIYSIRHILFRTCLFSIIFTTMTMYTHIYILIIFRFFIGWTFGTYVAVIPSFIKEITAKNMAPHFGTLPVINQSLGGFFGFVLGYGILEATGKVRDTWVIMVSLSIIPLIITMVCIHLDIIYESPVFLLKTGAKIQAQKTYKLIYKSQFVQSIMAEKELEIKKFYFNQLKITYTLSSQKFFKRKDILIGIHLPVLRKMSGVFVIILSSGALIRSVDPTFERVVPIIISFIYFLSCFLSNVIVKFFTRRASFQLGAISLSVLNICLAIVFYYTISVPVIVTFMVLVILMYGLTFGPLVWPYLPQVLPYRLIPIAQAMNSFVDIFTLSLPGVIIARNGNAYPLFIAFAIWNFFSIFVNYFLIIQTKHKTLNQILQQLKA